METKIIPSNIFQAYQILKHFELDYTERRIELVSKAIVKDGYEKAKSKIGVSELLGN